VGGDPRAGQVGQDVLGAGPRATIRLRSKPAVEVNAGRMGRARLGVIIPNTSADSLAVTELNGSLALSGAVAVPRDLASAQALLGAAAMLSKLLWPTPGGVDSHGRPLSPGAAEDGAQARARGRELRRALDNLKAPSPLETRRVRNAFEHFAERLDKYLYDSRGGQRLVVDRNIGPANQPFASPVLWFAPVFHPDG